MNHSRVICLGEILFDCLADEPNQSWGEVKSWTAHPGGAPANVACALVKLGTSAGFIGAVGSDEGGDRLLGFLQLVGVDTTGIQRHPSAPTRRVYVLRSGTGEREFAGFGNLNTIDFADAYLQAEAIPESLFVNADFLVLGTLELAYQETRHAISRALKLADRYNLKILVDINWRSNFWPDPEAAKPLIMDLLKQVDFVKLSESESIWLFDTTDPGTINYRLDSVEGVLVTKGDRGCSYCLGDHEGYFPGFSVPVQDTTGAGDGFVAGFIHQVLQLGIPSLHNPETARAIVTYASAVGALVTTELGAIAAQPTAAQVEEFLKQQP
ncbi:MULTISPECIES: carbohydrate kinase family protein [Limnospira]|uniref:PfkB domain protein n=1 Tax=Limnospira maxima CS-328 TaxID=513049 RepID=B5W3T5_LIMMA|nr:carbohydrate kinase [Limnospira maxima]EDZ93788.1 PfkB domain protein [Limnospira maxima CS-328]MDC0840585.1 carbohydrate kinase [Limnoraphis robusta]QJB26844.1 carbohydrate kinase [Limnospira fusiformis SAG 85.79]